MENIAVIGVLAALALAAEWWLRKQEAGNRPPTAETPADTSWGGLPLTHRSPRTLRISRSAN